LSLSASGRFSLKGHTVLPSGPLERVGNGYGAQAPRLHLLPLCLKVLHNSGEGGFFLNFIHAHQTELLGSSVYAGILPCFLGGSVWRLPARISSASIRRGRVSLGTMISSI
jgi:hypothetical protein